MSEQKPRNRVKFIAVFILGIVVCAGIYQVYGVVQPSFLPNLTLEQSYQDAIEDSMVAKSSEVYSSLTPVVESNNGLIWQGEPGNKSVLVVVFTKYASSYPVGGTVNTTWGDTWVTVAPEIQTFFKNYVNPDSNLTLRTLQVLGLPPSSGNTYFVELWVQPQSLFRPAPDNEITDTVAQLDFPASATAEYKDWFNGNIIYSYYPERFPWTRLGYTFDWGNPNSHVGLSEFVLKQGSTVTVKSVEPIADYLYSSD